MIYIALIFENFPNKISEITRAFYQEQNTRRFNFSHNFISDSLISAAFIGAALILWTFQIDFTRSTFKGSTPNKYWRVLARVYQRQPFVTHRLNGLKRNSCKMLHKVPYQREGGRKYLFRKLVKTELSKVLRTRGKLGGVKYETRFLERKKINRFI